MATITWSVQSISIIPSIDGFTDYAWRVTAVCSATNGANTKSSELLVQFDPATQTGGYTPYDQLTEAQVLSWVFNSVGADVIAQTETNLSDLLQAQVAPLPWVV